MLALRDSTVLSGEWIKYFEEWFFGYTITYHLFKHWCKHGSCLQSGLWERRLGPRMVPCAGGVRKSQEPSPNLSSFYLLAIVVIASSQIHRHPEEHGWALQLNLI